MILNKSEPAFQPIDDEHGVLADARRAATRRSRPATASPTTDVARLPWTEGGRYAPVIGPSGRVYAKTKYGFLYSLRHRHGSEVVFLVRHVIRPPVESLRDKGAGCERQRVTEARTNELDGVNDE